VYKVYLIQLCIFALFYGTSEQCAEFFLRSKDQGVTTGRSMEFAIDLKSEIMTQPKGTFNQGYYPPGHQADVLSWISKYDIVCAAGNGIDMCSDGMNSEGLSFSALLLPGYTFYDYKNPRDPYVVSNIMLGNWILGTFKSTKDVRDAINYERFPVVFNQIFNNLQVDLHYSIIDSTGDAIIIEYLKEGRKIYNNTIHVLTNSPPYDYHMHNIKNYIHLSKYTVDKVTLGDNVLKNIGLGNGLLGIPGDLSPPSRFVKAAYYTHFANTPEVDTSIEATNLAFHILNSMDIPTGVVGSKHNNSILFDISQWIIVKDLKNKIVYFRGYQYQSIRSIDLKSISGVTREGRLPIDDNFLNSVKDVTEDFLLMIIS